MKINILFIISFCILPIYAGKYRVVEYNMTLNKDVSKKIVGVVNQQMPANASWDDKVSLWKQVAEQELAGFIQQFALVTRTSIPMGKDGSKWTYSFECSEKVSKEQLQAACAAIGSIRQADSYSALNK